MMQGYRKSLICCLWAGLALLGAGLATAQEIPAGKNSLSAVRETVKQWVETERAIVSLDEAWRAERDTLNQIMTVLEAEITRLQEKVDRHREGLSGMDERRATLLMERDALKNASLVVEEALGELESGIKALHPRLPEPLQEQIAPLYTRLAGNTSQASLSQRMQNVVGILTQVDKFNGGFTLTSRVREVDGRQFEVKTLYAGLGAAWFSNGQGSYAGFLELTADGWVERLQPDLAPTILEAIAVYENPQRADFTVLPVTINE